MPSRIALNDFWRTRFVLTPVLFHELRKLYRRRQRRRFQIILENVAEFGNFLLFPELQRRFHRIDPFPTELDFQLPISFVCPSNHELLSYALSTSNFMEYFTTLLLKIYRRARFSGFSVTTLSVPRSAAHSSLRSGARLELRLVNRKWDVDELISCDTQVTSVSFLPLVKTNLLYDWLREGGDTREWDLFVVNSEQHDAVTLTFSLWFLLSGRRLVPTTEELS